MKSFNLLSKLHSDLYSETETRHIEKVWTAKAKWTVKPATAFSLILENESVRGNSENHLSQAKKMNN
jgi:hypothetical protein